MPTLSGGESQRVKMARQLDCDLVDLIYILDEPTVGLHPRDIDHLVAMLHRLRDHGNTVLVVGHDPAVVRAADWIVDIGDGGGDGGGKVVFSGRLDDLLHTDTATSRATPRRDRRTFDDGVDACTFCVTTAGILAGVGQAAGSYPGGRGVLST